MKKKKDDAIDYYFLLLGVMSFLNQFHHSNTEIFLGLIAQHIKSGIYFCSTTKEAKVVAEVRAEIANHIFFLEDFIRLLGHDLEVRKKQLPL